MHTKIIIAAAAVIASLGAAGAANAQTAIADVSVGGNVAVTIAPGEGYMGACAGCQIKRVDPDVSATVSTGILGADAKARCTYFDRAIGWVACKVTYARIRNSTAIGVIR